MVNETKETTQCTTCNHKHYKKYSGCPQCNCGESERVYTGTWRGFNPDAMYDGLDTAYERGESFRNEPHW